MKIIVCLLFLIATFVVGKWFFSPQAVPSGFHTESYIPVDGPAREVFIQVPGKTPEEYYDYTHGHSPFVWCVYLIIFVGCMLVAGFVFIFPIIAAFFVVRGTARTLGCDDNISTALGIVAGFEAHKHFNRDG